MKNSDPVRKRAKQVLRLLSNVMRLNSQAEHTTAFNQAVQDAQHYWDLIDKLSIEFSYMRSYIADKLHLGGHTLRQRRTAAINNAYAPAWLCLRKSVCFY